MTTRKEAYETEAMLYRLTSLLASNAGNPENHTARDDAHALRRISMTLHNWFELECGNSDNYKSWTIERDGDEDDSPPFMVLHPYGRNGEPTKSIRYRVADRESGARKRLAAILAKYPTLSAYVQTDPRGCALYILKPGDVPAGEDVSAYYSRGLAVYK